MRNLNYYLKHLIVLLCKRKLVTITLVLIILLIFIISNHLPKEDSFKLIEKNNLDKSFTIKSKCSCRKDLTIQKVGENRYLVDNKYFTDSINPTYEKLAGEKKDYTYDEYIKNFKHTCNIYNVLRRGPNQRVIGFSIYGSNVNYYKPLLILANAIKKYYPGWSVRVHYSSDIDQSVACEFECKEDIIDFCNVDELPFTNVNKTFAYYKGSYPHAMMWRWYPIGDDYVDYFMSRDSDSVTIQREKDSVDVWLYQKTNTLFHVMRDNPYHNTYILGGMWGYANIRNRVLGKSIYNLMLSSEIKLHYNPNGQNGKGLDQNFLTDHVWKHAKENGTIHDSYNCVGMGGEPFPSKRPDDRFCFAACFLPCCDVSLNQTARMPECPKECRPKDHQDWLFC